MANNLGDMVVRIVGNNAEFDSSIDKSESKLKKFSETASALGGNLSKFITLPLLAIGAAAVKSAGDMEQAQLAFETLLGSGEKARVLLGQLKKFADTTPFAFKDLAQGAKQLLSFGISAEKVLPIVKQLGDVALGDTERFNSLALAFGQIQSTGRLMGQDLLQLINAGFNPLQEISAKTGQSIGELKLQMEQGAISAQMVSDAFASATSEGGRFFEGTKKLGSSFNGLVSTLTDDAATLGRSFATLVLPTLKDIVKGASSIVQGFTSLDDTTKKIIVTLGLTAAAAGPVIAAIGGISKAFLLLQANPIVALIAGISTLTIGIATFVGEARKAEASRLGQVFESIATQTGVAKTSLDDFSKSALEVTDTIKKLANRLGGLQSVPIFRQEVERLTDSTGLSADQVLRLALSTGKLNGEVLKFAQNQIDGATITRNYFQVYQDGIQKSKDAQLKQAEEQKKINDLVAQEAKGLAAGQVEGIRELNALNQDNLNLITKIQAKEQERAELKVISDQIMKDSETAFYGNTITSVLDAQGVVQDYEETRRKEAQQTGKTIFDVNSAVFTQLGEDLAKGEVSWKSLGTAAINAIGEVINAIGLQMAALAGMELGKWIASKFLDGAALSASIKLGIESSAAITVGSFLKSVKLANGGIAMPTAGGVNATIAEAGQPEVVFPLDKLNQFISQGAFSPAGPSGGTQQIIVELDSRPILDKIFDATINQTVRISAGAVV